MERPHGTLLKAIQTTAEREGAYRFLESTQFSTDAIEAARGQACLNRMEACVGEMIIPVDQTSFNLPDHTGERDFGSVGNRSTGARGVHTLTALALDTEGVPLGVLSQEYWTRSETPSPPRIRPNKKERDVRPPEAKESRFWAHILEHLGKQFRQLSPTLSPWVQCDRGADFWRAFQIASDYNFWITVRVYTNRRITLDDGARGQLLPWMEALVPEGTTEVDVPTRADRPARKAKLSIRYGHVTVEVGPKQRGRHKLPLYFIVAREEQPPDGVEPLCWKLGTTFPVSSLADALRGRRQLQAALAHRGVPPDPQVGHLQPREVAA